MWGSYILALSLQEAINDFFLKGKSPLLVLKDFSEVAENPL